MIEEDLKDSWKKQLVDKGVDVSDFDNLLSKIIPKGIYRYLKFVEKIISMKDSQNIEFRNTLNIEMINKLYITDIILRREAFRIISPIEINLKSALLIELDEKANEDVLKTINWIYEEAIKVIDRKPNKIDLDMKRIERFQKELQEFQGHFLEYSKNSTISFNEFIDHSKLGDLGKILNAADWAGLDFSQWYNSKKKYKDFKSDFYLFKKIRNSVMHHHILFSVGKRPIGTNSDKPLQILLKFVADVFGINSEAETTFLENVNSAVEKHHLYVYKDEINEIYGLKLIKENVNE